MRVLVVQADPVVGDIEGNTRLCIEGIAAARASRARIVLFPELTISGYPPRDLLERRGLLRACREAAEEVARAATGVIAVYGAPWEDGGLRNSAIVAHAGRIAAVRHKSLLPTYDVFDEARYFVPADSALPVEIDGLRLGVTICEDIWAEGDAGRPPYARDPVGGLRGCDVVLNLSASPFHRGRARARMERVRRKAQQAEAPVVYCNQVGGNDELIFDGGSFAVRRDGALVAMAAQFGADRLLVDTDGPAIDWCPPGDEEEVVAALVLGIRDYARRCGFRTALVGLSGGIDSAVVAALAVRALGADNVYGVGMPGPFSSEGSVVDARELAERLGMRFELVAIGPMYDAFLGALAPLFAGAPRDLAEENLQARLRGTALMAMSNKFGHLLLTTGNKSEVAVGYCTLYGDMAGGLAVIADVYKTEVYRIARFLNREREIIPASTLTKPPSAELAPNQTDQDSLPPYETLDAIVRLFVEEGLEPAEITGLGHAPEIVEKVVRMVVRSEYKRWQAAPGLRVSPRAFGSGRRYPLAQRWK